MGTPNHCRIPIDTNQVWLILGYPHFSKPANCSVSTPRCSFQHPGGIANNPGEARDAARDERSETRDLQDVGG